VTYAVHRRQPPTGAADIAPSTPADAETGRQGALLLGGLDRSQESGLTDYLGAFAVTAGIGIDERVAEFERAHDDYSAILLKVLADRLAEAFAERLHERVRKEFWGYAADETLDNEAMIGEQYRGIRPAPGYPGLPRSHRKGFALAVAGCGNQGGIHLTESFRHDPDGGGERLVFQPPEARYFGVGAGWIAGSGRRIWGLRPAQGLDAGGVRSGKVAGLFRMLGYDRTGNRAGIAMASRPDREDHRLRHHPNSERLSYHTPARCQK
jgi:hypothetical protein